MMADIIRLNTCSGPGLEDVGAVFTDESYQQPPKLGNGKESGFGGFFSLADQIVGFSADDLASVPAAGVAAPRGWP
jgi:hypothetical protein